MHLGASGSSTSSCFANTRPSLAVATVRNARAECSRRHRAGCRSSSRTGGLVFFAVVVSNRFFCFGAKAGVRARLPIAVSRSGQIYLFDLARHFCNLSLSPSHPLSSIIHRAGKRFGSSGSSHETDRGVLLPATLEAAHNAPCCFPAPSQCCCLARTHRAGRAGREALSLL